jgi:hypothetical protein
VIIFWNPEISFYQSADILRVEDDNGAEFSGTEFAQTEAEIDAMSLVRLLGFTTLGCGCVVGRYREVATSREVNYVEEKGKACGSHGHRRNHTVVAGRSALTPPVVFTSKAS